MNARQEAEHLRRICGASGRVNVEEVAHLVGMEIDERQFRAQEVDEIAFGSNIAVGDQLREPERRWAVAHAIGHYVLHGRATNHIWLRTCTQLPDKLERQAEDFAYALLVDEDEALDEGLETVHEIAGFYGVPPERAWLQSRLW